MTITLSREQLEWLEAEVAAGHFPSVEDAVRLAVAELMRPIDTDDLSWAKPYVDEARLRLIGVRVFRLKRFCRNQCVAQATRLTAKVPSRRKRVAIHRILDYLTDVAGPVSLATTTAALKRPAGCWRTLLGSVLRAQSSVATSV